MRPLLLLLLLGFTLGGCRCGAANPTPVTLRVKNTSTAPIYVDDTGGVLGMEVQRNQGGSWQGFVEQPDCSCQACDVVCGGCDCDAGASGPMVEKILPGTTAERQWDGIVQVSGIATCNGSLVGGTSCLRPDIPAVNETFQVHFCYAPAAPEVPASDGGTPVPGSLQPGSLLCVDRAFQISDGVVEVSPAPGQQCTSSDQCQQSGDGGTALCFSGTCTTSCPANDFPAVGASWQVHVPQPDDYGFFTTTQSGAMTILSGTGTVTSVRYDSANTTTLRLSRPSPAGGVYTGALYVTLPPSYAVPFNVGETVTVKVIDASTRTNYDDRAVTVRDATGQLLLAADPAQLGAVLAAADTAPFTVSNSLKAEGCEFTSCGKRIFYSTDFSSPDGDGGSGLVELDPGKSSTVVASGATFTVLNVGNSAYVSTPCALPRIMPYAILNARTAP